jgi:hypothetical protein
VEWHPAASIRSYFGVVPLGRNDRSHGRGAAEAVRSDEEGYTWQCMLISRCSRRRLRRPPDGSTARVLGPLSPTPG